ncbi:MAG: hypothetical protein A2Y28_05540 [Chlamydiae bacterium GWC2_50_10]|nr:MAG: hypothetical protein A2Y28_05540 [Chlamydiae bacterium GWC2_50_10]
MNNIKDRSYKFALLAIKFISKLPNKRLYWVIGDQLLRSATSIGANIIEAKGASSKKDFINFYSHSLKSANETIYWLSLLKDAQTLKTDYFEILIKEAKELAKMIAASIITMKNSSKLKTLNY